MATPSPRQAPQGGVTYTWNGENRLREVEEDGSSEQYTYAATGLRRSKTTGAGTTEFLWDGHNLFAELDEALATVAQYTDWPGTWGGLTSARRAGASEWLTYDMSANTRLLLSTVADVEQAYAYRAFGPELTGAAAGNPFRFGGLVEYYGDAAERVYVRARYYHPATGRWIARDPLGVGFSAPYRYVRNHAVSSLDASGHYSIATPPGAAIAAECELDIATGGYICEILPLIPPPPVPVPVPWGNIPGFLGKCAAGFLGSLPGIGAILACCPKASEEKYDEDDCVQFDTPPFWRKWDPYNSKACRQALHRLMGKIKGPHPAKKTCVDSSGLVWDMDERQSLREVIDLDDIPECRRKHWKTPGRGSASNRD